MKTTFTKRLSIPIAVLLFLSTGLIGCKTIDNMSRTEKGAAAGAGAGAVVGGVIGKATGSTAKGAIIGAVVGGTAGAIIGQQMDKQARELEQELEGAEVERVGEGIQITFDSAILFGCDRADLSATARTNLSELAASLKKYPNTEVMIVGHTDAVGSEEYNQRLSERRANSAAEYLISQGISRSRITTLGKGELEPVASNEDEIGRQQNRRVEVAIFASEEYREELSNN